MNNAYSIIPTMILHDKNLRDKAKLLYGEIASLSNEKGFCFASNRYLANIFNCSITTISTLISELARNNYITIEYAYKNGTKEILYRYLKIFNGVFKKIEKNNNINIKNIRLKEYNKIPKWIETDCNEIIMSGIELEEMEDLFNE